MMCKIVEYKLHADTSNNKITPYFIKDGGYFPDNNKGTLIGVLTNDKTLYIPNTIIEVTKDDLIERLIINNYKNIIEIDGALPEHKIATRDEIIKIVDDFINFINKRNK